MLKYLESSLFFKSFLLVLRVFMGFTGFTVLVRKIHIFQPNISLILPRTTNVGCNTQICNHKADHVCHGHYVEENKSVDSFGNKLQLRT
ncbi:hypothetical protein Bca4012_043776 [Brassica carinata]